MPRTSKKPISGVVLAKKLKADSNFVPCPVADGDELYPNGIFVFNITKMLEYIRENHGDIILEEIEVSNFPEKFSSINESHMDSVDIYWPVILAEISPGCYNVIDGNHRMEKARRTGVKSIQAYKLNSKQHVKFLTSQRAYAAYIEYWNSKLYNLGSPKDFWE